MQTEKFQPEGRRKQGLPSGGTSRSASETDDRFYVYLSVLFISHKRRKEYQ